MKVKLKKVRLAFPKLFVAEPFSAGGKPVYSAAFLFNQDDENFNTVVAAIEAVAKDTFKNEASAVLKQLKAQDKICLHDGDLKSNLTGYAGKFFVNARSAHPPALFDRDKTKLTSDTGRLYSGAFVNASLDIWGQNNAYGKRINATLLGVQFSADGERFGGTAPASADDFDSEDEGDDVW